jgi:hypothetical protein
MTARPVRRMLYVLAVALCLWTGAFPTTAAEPTARVYVILWFDTEDYILPASDDAALHIADFLSREGIRATFKVVGEKARTLERRGRNDVIAALKKHEIGYHSNFHSVQPTPAMYCSNLGWDDGVAEFDRRERPGFEDVKRIFGVAPSCYGQPGSSWSPQSYGAIKGWGMNVYLDAGRHIALDDRPCYYCGVLNLYKLKFLLRAGLGGPKDLEAGEQRFVEARKQLMEQGGGIVSTIYHPCEFVHEKFWDGVNFRAGANPPREQWQLPPTKTAEQSKAAYQVFEDYVRFMKRFPEVQFITASQAAELYRDPARGRAFTPAELRKIAAAMTENVSFQQREDYTLSASEVFVLLNHYVAERLAGRSPASVSLENTPYGPSEWVAPLTEAVPTDASQFARTAADVADFLHKQRRIPTSVWLGSMAVPPEMFLRGLAQVTIDLIDGKEQPKNVTLPPAKLAAAAYVADDDPSLWKWVIFPPGFRAPAMMELAKRQAWTLKPALLAKR